MVKGKAFRNSAREARKGTHKRASSRVKSIKRDTYAERKAKKQAMEEVKQKQTQLLEARKEVRKMKAKKRGEKKKRKEENEIRAGQYQVIKKTEKIRKWHKNARRQLMTLGPDQIDRLLAK